MNSVGSLDSSSRAPLLQCCSHDIHGFASCLQTCPVAGRISSCRCLQTAAGFSSGCGTNSSDKYPLGSCGSGCKPPISCQRCPKRLPANLPPTNLQARPRRSRSAAHSPTCASPTPISIPPIPRRPRAPDLRPGQGRKGEFARIDFS